MPMQYCTVNGEQMLDILLFQKMLPVPILTYLATI